MREKTEVIADICALVARGDLHEASAALLRDYPFASRPVVTRNYTASEAVAVFRRDGFIDRYSGDRLIFPGVLRLLSLTLPAELPFHPNWKMTETHVAYWELSPTVDHIVPIARGGRDIESNWATTSMVRNSAKANWTLEELGWSLRSGGSLAEWDGLLSWFNEYVSTNKAVLDNSYIRNWHRAAGSVAAV